MVRKKEIHSNILLFIFLAFSLWQVLLIVLVPISFKVLPARERFMYSGGSENLSSNLFRGRANFNGIHYLKIAVDGYGLNQQSLFPFYPNLIKFIAPLFAGNVLISSLFISNLSFLIALFILYKLLRIDYEENAVKKTIFFLIIFPTSFFFGMSYSEGIFFLLLIGSLYCARKGNWLLAGIFGGLVSYTKLTGIMIFPALIFEWVDQTKKMNSFNKISKLLPTFLVFMGTMVYMKYLSTNYNDPFKFIHVQPFFGTEIISGKLILTYQVFFRYFKMVTTTKQDPLYFAVWLEFLTAVGFSFLLISAFFKKIRPSYLIFSVIGFLAPTLTGSFSSLPRYVLSLFPCFIVLGLIKRKVITVILSIIFILLLIISTAFFYRGYWIA